jgi:hypothetical protein
VLLPLSFLAMDDGEFDSGGGGVGGGSGGGQWRRRSMAAEGRRLMAEATLDGDSGGGYGEAMTR